MKKSIGCPGAIDEFQVLCTPQFLPGQPRQQMCGPPRRVGVQPRKSELPRSRSRLVKAATNHREPIAPAAGPKTSRSFSQRLFAHPVSKHPHGDRRTPHAPATAGSVPRPTTPRFRQDAKRSASRPACTPARKDPYVCRAGSSRWSSACRDAPAPCWLRLFAPSPPQGDVHDQHRTRARRVRRTDLYSVAYSLGFDCNVLRTARSLRLFRSDSLAPLLSQNGKPGGSALHLPPRRPGCPRFRRVATMLLHEPWLNRTRFGSRARDNEIPLRTIFLLANLARRTAPAAIRVRVIAQGRAKRTAGTRPGHVNRK
jgi:hypothetical protein